MGRTITSFNQLVRHLQQEDWGKFRRALRREDQQLLDELFEMARFHAAPAAYASRPNPMEPIVVSMLIEMLKRLREVEERLPKGEAPSDGAQQRLDF